MSPEQHEILTGWIAARLPNADKVSISRMQPPGSGGSNLTALFDLSYDDGGPNCEPLVLRTVAEGPGLFPDYDLGLQAGVMRALQSTPVLVPDVRWFEPERAILGSPFIIMRRIEGVTPSDTAPGFHGHGLFFDATEAERARMWWAAHDAILQLQALDWHALRLPRLVGMAESADDAIRQHLALFKSYLDWAGLPALPAIERGLAWLEAATPPDGPLVLNWGDARPGNIFYNGGRVSGLLDWELAAVGVPEADIAYLIWSAEFLADLNHTPRLAGLPSREETWARYTKFSGRSDSRIQYGEVFTLVRLSIMIVLGLAKSGAISASPLNDNIIDRTLSHMLKNN